MGIDFDTFNISLKKQSQAILPWQNKLQILAAKFRLDEAMFFLFHFLFNEINLSLSGKCWRIKDAIQHLTQIYRASLRHLQIKLHVPWVWGLPFLEARFNTEVIFTFVQREVRRCPSTSTVERKPKKRILYYVNPMTRLSAIWDLPFDRAVNIYTLHPDFSGYTSKWNSGDGISHSSMWDNLSKLFLFIACFPSWRKPKLFTDNEGRSFFFCDLWSF